MKTLQFNYLLLFILIGFLLPSSSIAQKKGTTTKKHKTSTHKKVKPAAKENKKTTLSAQLDKMSRDERNTLSKCPLHQKQMFLSDNFEADASNSAPSASSPFAYQLNYRRYCSACTRIQKKEIKVSHKTDNTTDAKHCPVHKTALVGNPDYDRTDFEKKPLGEIPHAKQYRLKNYCKVCTKVYKIQK